MTARDIIVEDADTLAACCAAVRAAPAVGFDTEFVGEDTFAPELCLVQIATPDALYLIDPLGPVPLDDFWAALTEPGRPAVVHAGREEVRMCGRFAGRPPADLFDVQLAAGLLGLGYPVGHGGLVKQVLGVKVEKGETLTDWRRRPLTAKQIEYAFDDVRHLLPLHAVLTKRLGKLGRLDWAAEDHAAFVEQSMAASAPEKWRKLRGAGQLGRQALAVLRELYDWRQAAAERHNRPPRSMVRDDLLVEVAKRQPKNEKDLKALRGLGGADAEGVLACVRRGREVPQDQWPQTAGRDNDPPQVALVASLLQAVLTDWCARNQMTPVLAATMQDLKQLVRARAAGGSTPAESPLASGWRRDHVLPELEAVLGGRRLIRVGDLSTSCPLVIADGPAEGV